MIYDCFFSYQKEDLPLVESLANELENRGFSCWYAPRNIVGRYGKAIADGISHSKVFILVLNERSAVSEAVLNEVELAHNVAKNSHNDLAVIQPLCTNDFDMNDINFQEMMYYIRRYQFVYIKDNESIDRIANSLIKSQKYLISKSDDRQKSYYVVQKAEDQRLKKQNEISRLFDIDLYQEIFKKYQNSNVLDVGCGTGEMLVPITQQFSLANFVGIDKSERQILIAKEKYQMNNYHFEIIDIETTSFEDNLISLMKTLDIDKFDIINISMVLLHLKKPVEVLKILRKYLADDGIMTIRDIDDGLNFAWPDPKHYFDRIYKICRNNEQSGNRQNGRQIYHDLVMSSFSHIQLLKQGLSTAGMNSEQKDILFQIYFPFILANAQEMKDKYPRSVEYHEDYLWLQNVIEEIHDCFKKDDFIFSLGFVFYIAKK